MHKANHQIRSESSSYRSVRHIRIVRHKARSKSSSYINFKHIRSSVRHQTGSKNLLLLEVSDIRIFRHKARSKSSSHQKTMKPRGRPREKTMKPRERRRENSMNFYGGLPLGFLPSILSSRQSLSIPPSLAICLAKWIRLLLIRVIRFHISLIMFSTYLLI